MLCRNDSREDGRGLEKIRKIITITMKRVFIVSLMLVVCLAAAAQKKKELTTLVNVNYTLPKVAYEVESSALIFRLLELNSGISFMPIAQVLKIHRTFSEHADKIHMARIKDEIPKANIGLAYHRSYVFTHAANCLLEHVREFFRDEDRALEQFRI